MHRHDCTNDRVRKDAKREWKITRYVWNVPTKTNRGEREYSRGLKIERTIESEKVDWYVFSGCATRTCQRAYILCHTDTRMHARLYTRGFYLLLSRRTYKSAGRLSEYFPSNLISCGWNARYACVTSHISGDEEMGIPHMAIEVAFWGVD